MITGKEKIPTDSEVLNPTSDADKEMLRICKANKNAYAYLMLSCTDDTSFSAIDEARTTDLMEGDASLAWQNLLDLYKPKDQTTEVKLLTEFQELGMKANEKPNTYFSEVEYLQGQLKEVKYNLTDNQIIAQLITTLPKIYQDYLPVLNKQMKDTTNPLTLKELKGLLHTAYKAKNKNTTKNDNIDTAFIATGGGFKKQFKGQCSKCGRWGHKATECKSDTMNGFKGKCNYCNIARHKEEDCQKKKRDMEQNNGNSSYNNNNRNNNNMKHTQYNYAFMTTNMDISTKDFWIADTGASAHITNNNKYMFNIQKIKKSEYITVGNGENLQVEKTGDIQVKCKQPNGDKVTQNIKYIPKMMVNLFSLTRAMTDGAKLTSNDKYIGIQKSGSTLWFNHSIEKCEEEMLVGAKFERIPALNYGLTAIKAGTKVSLAQAHEYFGHANKNTTRMTAKSLG